MAFSRAVRAVTSFFIWGGAGRLGRLTACFLLGLLPGASSSRTAPAHSFVEPAHITRTVQPVDWNFFRIHDRRFYAKKHSQQLLGKLVHDPEFQGAGSLGCAHCPDADELFSPFFFLRQTGVNGRQRASLQVTAGLVGLAGSRRASSLAFFRAERLARTAAFSQLQSGFSSKRSTTGFVFMTLDFSHQTECRPILPPAAP